MYAPEAGTPQHIVWLAVHKSRATLSISANLNYQTLLEEELGAEGVTRFRSQLLAEGVAPEDYLLMPAHGWQWHNRLAMFFAADIANRMIVCLGLSEDAYLAQQSIRTFFNISAPHKRYVKTSLSVLNMGFMRGLSPYYMLATPAINDQVKAMVAADPYLQGKGFDILREVAAIGYRNPYYEAGIQENNAYKKMLSCLWRESPLPHLKEGERLMTMTALLHIDNEGQSLLAALIEASGLPVQAWVDAYLDVYLSPLLHCFHQHDLVFMPHGENLILVMKGHRPVRALMKDIAEEVAIFDKDAVLPEAVQRMAVDVPDHLRTLSLFIDVFEGFLRHLAAILHQHAGYIDADFWQRVAVCVHRYQAEHPGLESQVRTGRPVCRRLCPLLPEPAADRQQPAHAESGGPGRQPSVRRASGQSTGRLAGCSHDQNVSS
ncbi:MAG: IucA/IucC family protein [Aquabacterium sp.]